MRNDEPINISDVIEIIETDPDFQESPTTTTATMLPRNSQRQRPYVRIVEQPAPKTLRFRYECEGRSAGSIPGISSTSDNKTYPTIQVVGYRGNAKVIVSCVTVDEPYRVHPHNLVGKDCKDGICQAIIPPETMTVTFTGMGIQCVKKKDIEKHLKSREEKRLDPFGNKFKHISQPTSIDLNAVRLCFQVYLQDPNTRQYNIALPPIVSDPVYDKKAKSDLAIIKLSHCVCYVDGSCPSGGDDIILLCEKVTKEDIQIRFYEERNGNVVWEDYGDFQPSQVHKQTAIWFRAPRYPIKDITEPVKVNIQLRRPSDNTYSEPLPFEYLPLDSDRGRKRRKFDEMNAQLNSQIKFDHFNANSGQNFLSPPMDLIKIEPRDNTPSPYGGNVYAAASPSSQAVSPAYVPQLDPIVQWNIPSAASTSEYIPNILSNWPQQQQQFHQQQHQQQQQQQQPQEQQQHLLQHTMSQSMMAESNLNLLLDLNRPLTLNSGDLTVEGNNLSESFNSNLNLNDLDQNRDNPDSLSGILKMLNR